MKKAFRIFMVSLAVLVTLMGIVYLVAWKSPPYYKVSQKYDPKDSIIHFKDYSTEHARPFIISSDKYVIFGAEHTRDCNHKEIKMIENSWNRLKPTIALVEGRLGFLLPGFMDPVENLGEGGKVKALAHKRGIPVLTGIFPRKNWQKNFKANSVLNKLHLLKS